MGSYCFLLCFLVSLEFFKPVADTVRWVTDRRGSGYSAFTAAPARADPARRKIAQNREGKMIDTSLFMPVLRATHATVAQIAGKANSNYLLG